jgi:site-specific DNA recombinase
MSNNDIKYFIYVRKSTESDGRQVLSIPGQIDDTLLLKKRENLTVIETLADSHSAKIPFNRPTYSNMIKRIKRGEASGIIVWHIDRLARNHLEWGELMHLLQTGVIKSIWTMNREYQSQDSALLIGLEASMATQYSVDLGRRVYNGLHRKAAAGIPPFPAPFGYINTKLPISGTNSIVPDRKRWKIMRKAFELMLTGQYTIAQIAHIMNHDFNFRTRDTKNRSGKPMCTSVLHRAFINPFYYGYFYYTGTLYKGTYTPLITVEEYNTIQELLGRKDKSKPLNHEFAFTGFIKCSCGLSVTASRKLKVIKSTGAYKTYTFYHCTKRKGAKLCPEKAYTTEASIEAIIIAELEKIQLTPLWKDWAFETVKEDYHDELDKHQSLLNTTKAHERKLLQELDTLLDLRIENQLSDERYKEKKAEREFETLRVREKIKRIETNVNDWIRQVKDKLDFAENAIEKFKTGNEKAKKEICQDLGWNWVLHDKNLLFTRHEWFSDLEYLKNYYEGKKDRLEPIKTFEKYKESEYFEGARPYLSRLRDDIRTKKKIITTTHRTIIPPKFEESI